MEMRWKNYILNQNTKNCIHFWKNYLKNKKDILYILGLGFDPRTLNGIKLIYNIDGKGKRDVLSVRYFQSKEEELNNISTFEVRNHQIELESFLQSKRAKHEVRPIIIRDEQKSIASIKANNIIENIERIKSYSDVIVDISAMPRGVFMPLINKLLKIIDEHGSEKINLHVIVTENYRMDSLIVDQGVEQTAEFIYGLSIPNITLIQKYKEVWITIIGEQQLEQYEKIRNSLDPVSTCVILPFPSKQLRRGDELINTYQDKILNDKDFDIKNILYADEQNPFQVYRLIRNTIERHRLSLKIFEGAKVIISVLSSKLLTVGAFLAAYESKSLEIENKDLKVGIKHVDSISHKFAANKESSEILEHNELFHMWLTGEPYVN